MDYNDEIQIETALPERKISRLKLDTFIAILDNVYKGVVCVDKNGLITFLSRSNERFYNLKRGEAIGKHVTEVIKNSKLHRVAKTGKPEIGYIMEVKDGLFRIVERIPIKKNGELIGAIGKIMFSDVDKGKVLSEQIQRLERQVYEYQEQIKDIFCAKYTLKDIIGKSAAIKKMRKTVEQIARPSSTVLIEGESGTGKELIAQAIHNASPRSNFPFVRINCASVPPELFESEFFGYEEGAFTGSSRKGKKGKFEVAHRGSIFLDEISEMPLYMQAKLLRVLQEKEIVRIGGQKPILVDFRLITSTNQDLRRLVAKGRFREDLLYRLYVINLKLPPLRERKEDLEVLIPYFIKKLNLKLGTLITELSDEAWQTLMNRDWKGNVRELMNVLERAMAISEGHTLGPENLENLSSSGLNEREESRTESLLLRENAMLAEKKAIQRALKIAKGNKNKASRLLGISRSGLYQKMEIHQIPLMSKFIQTSKNLEAI